MDLTQALVDAPPARPTNRPLLATSYHRLGILLRQTGRLREAEAAYRKAVELAGAIGGNLGVKIEAGAEATSGSC